jgi:hypothetical protein
MLICWIAFKAKHSIIVFYCCLNSWTMSCLATRQLKGGLTKQIGDIFVSLEKSILDFYFISFSICLIFIFNLLRERYIVIWIRIPKYIGYLPCCADPIRSGFGLRIYSNLFKHNLFI